MIISTEDPLRDKYIIYIFGACAIKQWLTAVVPSPTATFYGKCVTKLSIIIMYVVFVKRIFYLADSYNAQKKKSESVCTLKAGRGRYSLDVLMNSLE